MKTISIPVVVLVFLLCAINLCLAQETCESLGYVILKPNLMYVLCDTEIPKSWKYVQLWQYPDDPRKKPIRVSAKSSVGEHSDIGALEIKISPDLPVTFPGEDYFLLLSTDEKFTQVERKLDFSTSLESEMSNQTAAIMSGREFQVKTNIAITNLADVHKNQQNVTEVRCSNSSEKRNATKRDSECDELEALTRTVDNFTPAHRDPLNDPDDRFTPENFGLFKVTFKDRTRLTGKRTLKIDGLVDAFDRPQSIIGDVEFTLPPKGKDDAEQYYQVSHKVSPNAKPSFLVVIDAHTLPGLDSDFFIGNFLVEPNIEVDIATREFQNESNDKIRLGIQATNAYLFGVLPSKRWALQLGPGFTFETNRAFDKNNLLATFEVAPHLRTYRSREMRKAVADANLKPGMPARSLEEFKTGYGIEFSAGIDAGRNINSQEFQNEDETQSIEIPGYSIFRVRPNLHAFVEYKWFTLDLSETLRILAVKEAVGRELEDGSVEVRRLRGARNYFELTASIAFDPEKHYSIATTYKRGSEPPEYDDVDTLVTGFVIKY
jgi:hypothetical protein